MTITIITKENENGRTQVVRQGATWFVETYKDGKEVYHFATRNKNEAEDAFARA